MRMQKVVPAALRVATAAKDGAEGKGYLGTPSWASIGYGVWNLTAKFLQTRQHSCVKVSTLTTTFCFPIFFLT
jgi:hypothetical protein